MERDVDDRVVAMEAVVASSKEGGVQGRRSGRPVGRGLWVPCGASRPPNTHSRFSLRLGSRWEPTPSARPPPGHAHLPTGQGKMTFPLHTKASDRSQNRIHSPTQPRGPCAAWPVLSPPSLPTLFPSPPSSPPHCSLPLSLSSPPCCLAPCCSLSSVVLPQGPCMAMSIPSFCPLPSLISGVAWGLHAFDGILVRLRLTVTVREGGSCHHPTQWSLLHSALPGLFPGAIPEAPSPWAGGSSDPRSGGED